MNTQETTPSMHEGKKLWQRPWGYLESFIVTGALILVGFLIEFIMQGKLVPTLHRPYNIIFLGALVAVLVIIHAFFRKSLLVKWLSSVPCSISAIIAYAILVLLMGFIKQEAEHHAAWMKLLGLTHLKNSFPFLFLEIYLLISLGLVVLRRSYPFSVKNIGFMLNHLGLWITLIAAGLGSGDLQRLNLYLYENGPYINTSYAPEHKILILPFSLKLLDFKMELYNPKIMIADTISSELSKQHGEVLPVIEKGSDYTLHNWNIHILKVLLSSMRTGKGYVESAQPLSAAAAYIHARNMISGDTLSGWLCSGSMLMAPEYIQLEKSMALCILNPEPKKFESLVVVKDKSGKVDTTTIEVNKPFKSKGWSFYQISYDESMGPASNMSKIEAVYDPWLKVVYFGITLMLAGALYLFWLGRGARSDGLTR